MKNIFLLVFLSIGFMAQGQFSPKDFSKMKFRSIGPSGMSGRVTAIDVDLSNTDIMYVGTASGGIWKSENGGITFAPIFDDQHTLSIGSIKINQANPSEIWVGTGEGNPRNSLNTGRGIYKSIDGGKTWKCMGLENTRTIHRIIIDPRDPNTVIAAAPGSPWGKSKDRGVYKTKDGGKTWKNVLYVNDLTGAADMVVDPNNPNKILVAMWEHLREPWFFNSGGKGSGMYMSTDGGDTFKRIESKDGLPEGDLGRIGIAFATNKSNIVYALVEAKVNGLYKSTDGGYTWSLVSTKNIGNRPFYYAEIYVDPSNENRIYNLYTYLSKSEDGGKTFKQIANYQNGVHPDHHAFWINPHNPDHIVDGNDGGLNISKDGGNNWYFAGNIPVGQFYHVNVDTDFPYNVYGGMQDNGSWVGPSSVLKRGGIRNNDYSELYFGDGFDVVPFKEDSRYGYAMSQGGNVAFYDRETGRTKFIKPTHPDPEVKLRFNWNSAIAQDPFNARGVYFASQYLHYSDNCGDTWKILSPDLTTNDTTRQKSNESGGLTLDATFAENFTTILAIAPSPLDKDIIWVGTDDGNLQITTDGGKTWNNLANKLKGLPKGSWIPQIHVSEHNKAEAWVVCNNYRRNDYRAFAYHTDNYGKTWTRIVEDKDIGSFALSIVQDHKEPNLVFLGTDEGLYVSFDKGGSWKLWDEGLPQVQIADMKIHPIQDDLILGTFGRALYILDDINPLRAIAAKGENVLKGDFAIFPSTPGYKMNYRSYDGVRFAAQAEFIGDNRYFNAVNLNIWKKPQEKKSKKKEKATVHILNTKGDTIRTFKREIKDGLNKVAWDLYEDGVRFPSRKEAKKDADAPRGLAVLPGSYKAIVKYKDWKDSTDIQVKPDPRLEYSPDKEEAKRKVMEDHHQMIKTMSADFEKLKKAKKAIEIVEKLAENQPKEVRDTLASTHKGLKKEIETLMSRYVGKKDIKGIQRDPTTLSRMYYTAVRYINSAWGTVSPNALNTVSQFNGRAKKVSKRVADFMDGDFKDYLDEVEKLDLKVYSEK